jgi:hypothetical protein
MSRDPRKRPSRYHVFVLSLWEESAAFPAQASTWRFSLEQAQAAGRKGFKSLTELTAYLEAWMQAPSGDAPLVLSDHSEPDTR